MTFKITPSDKGNGVNYTVKFNKSQPMLNDWFKENERQRTKVLNRLVRYAFLEGVKIGGKGEFDYCSGYESDRDIWRSAKKYYDDFLKTIGYLMK